MNTIKLSPILIRSESLKILLFRLSLYLYSIALDSTIFKYFEYVPLEEKVCYIGYSNYEITYLLFILLIHKT